MQQTKGARFNAAKRLEDRSRRRATLIAYASISVVVVTLLPAFFDLPVWLRAAISLATIAMSLVILVYSMLQAQNRDLLVAHQLHSCALEINSLRREVRTAISLSLQQASEYTKKYDDILRRYNVNHDPIDYEKYKLDHPDDFPAISEKVSEALKKEVSGPERLLGIVTATVAVTGPALIFAALLTSQSEPLIHWLKALMAFWRSG
jgi:hypothetical protein